MKRGEVLVSHVLCNISTPQVAEVSGILNYGVPDNYILLLARTSTALIIIKPSTAACFVRQVHRQLGKSKTHGSFYY